MTQTHTVRFAFGIVFLSVLSALIIGSIFSALDPSILSGDKPGLLTYIAMFIGQSVLVVPVVLFLIRKKYPLIKSLRLNPVSKNIINSTILLSLGAMIISDEINILVDMVIPMPDSFLQIEAMLTPDNPLSMALLLFTIVLLAPIGEEVIFRGFLQKYLEDVWGDVTRAVLFSSLFFAVIHFNPYWMIQIYLLGVILGYLAWYTNSIIPSIIFHIIINATSLLFTSMGDSFESIIVWHGHINPIIFLLAIASFWVGFKQLKNPAGDKK
ncbi:MAG: type II CAAX endopeptidase family protein [Candidatus Marinimicrobia bacterium]|nr:type II CAAX endopeptidase family protein [Candidatus Neomarinimicrobiota bacterium]|tara:strand:+ start:316 stop:1119 length:804 start_codon:yes stop_codon:yes gene_type:complete